MKKLLLSLACFVGFIGTVNAETVSVTFSDMFDANSTELAAIELDDGITVGFAKGSGSTAPQYYTNGTAVRWYGGNTMTVTSESNTITNIEITFGGSDGSNQISANPGSFNTPTWTGSASSVVFTVGGTSGNRRVAGLTITYGEDAGGGNTGGETPGPSTPTETINVTYDSSTKGYANAQEISTVEEGDVTIEFNKGSNSNTPKYYTSGTAVRVYGGGYFTVSVPANCTITTIELIYGGTPGTNAITTDVGTFSTPTWTGEAQSVKFTIGGTSGNRQIKAINVTYEKEGTLAVAAPKISCTDNEITITCATDDVDIYYTLDGTEPTQSSTKYTEPFKITQNTEIKAIAYKGNEASAVTTFTATFVGNYSGFQEFAALGNGAQGAVDGPITAVYQNGQYLYVIDNSQYPMLIFGNVNASLSNGDQIDYVEGTYSPYQNLPEITSPKIGDVTTGGTEVEPKIITLSEIESTTLNSYVQINNVTLSSATAMADNTGSGVLYNRFTGVNIPTDYTKTYNVTGFVAIFGTTYQIYPTAFEAIVNVNQVATPVIDPNGGDVELGTEVTITTETEGATIYYTTDGNEPTTTSRVYNPDAPIVVTQSMTVKAYAVKADMTDSAIASASFTVIEQGEKEATFNFTDPATLNPQKDAPASDGEDTIIAETNFESNGVNLYIGPKVGNYGAPRLWNSNNNIDFRIYTSESFSIAVDLTQYHITKIEFTKSGGSFAFNATAGTFSGSGNNRTWNPTGSQAISDVRFDVTGTTRIDTITVYYAEGAGVSTGVESIEAVDNGEAVYYNLQGVKVANPDRGLYIKVQNGKATKIMK